MGRISSLRQRALELQSYNPTYSKAFKHWVALLGFSAEGGINFCVRRTGLSLNTVPLNDGMYFYPKE